MGTVSLRELQVTNRKLIWAAVAIVLTAMAGVGIWALYGPVGFTGIPIEIGTLIWATVAGMAGLAGLGVALYVMMRGWAETREMRAYEKMMDDPLEITYLIPKEQYKKTGVAGLAQKLLDDAKREGDRIKERAQKEAEEQASPILEDARTQSEQTLAEAQRQAGEMLKSALAQLQPALSQARQEAQQQAEATLSEAQQEAQRQAQETLRQGQEAAKRESESILESALKRAREHEARAKQAAHHTFGARARRCDRRR